MSKFIFKYKLGQKFLFKGIDCQVCYINNGNAWLSPLKDDSKLGIYKGCAFAVVNCHREDKDGTLAISHKMLDKVIERLVAAHVQEIMDCRPNPCGAA